MDNLFCRQIGSEIEADLQGLSKMTLKEQMFPPDRQVCADSFACLCVSHMLIVQRDDRK